MRRALMLAAGAGIFLAGCGSSHSTRTVTTVQTVTASQAAPVTSSNEITLQRSAGRTQCSVYAAGNDAEVTFYSSSFQVRPDCNLLEQQEAAQGSTWVNDPQPGSMTSADGPICDLRSAPGQAQSTLIVTDSGGAYIGNQICQGYIAAGWLEIN